MKAAHQVLDYDASVFGIVASDLFSREAPQLPLIPVLLEDTVDGNLIDIKTKNYTMSPTSSSYRCMETGPILVADRTLEPGFTAHKFGNNERISQSLAFFPIKFGDENIGVISVQSYTPGKFGQGTLEILEDLALYASGALGRTRKDQYQRIFETALSHASDMILISAENPSVASGATIVYVNDAFCIQTGYGRNEITGKSPRMLFGPATDQKELERLKHSLMRDTPLGVEVTAYRKDGSFYQSEISAFSHLEAATGTRYYFSIQRDITEKKRQQQELTFLAFHDQLTGLPNRVLLTERVERAIGRAQRIGEDFAILYCDLDGFKEVNDTYGHMAGDQILKEVSSRLKSSVRPTDTVARLGGDEFVVLLEFTPSEEHICEVANRILANLREGFQVEGKVTEISISIGICRYTSADTSVDELLHRADQALYECKHSGKDKYVVYQGLSA